MTTVATVSYEKVRIMQEPAEVAVRATRTVLAGCSRYPDTRCGSRRSRGTGRSHGLKRPVLASRSWMTLTGRSRMPGRPALAIGFA